MAEDKIRRCFLDHEFTCGPKCQAHVENNNNPLLVGNSRIPGDCTIIYALTKMAVAAENIDDHFRKFFKKLESA